DVQKELRPIRKALGTERYKEYLKANGITWEENKEHAGADTMRASMAAKKWIESGNRLNEQMYKDMLSGKSPSKREEKPTENSSQSVSASGELKNIAAKSSDGLDLWSNVLGTPQ